MKIINLRVESYKRLSAVEITPAGALVTISGKNGMGKSSVLDAIYAALAGRDAIAQKPIRNGETRALIRLDMGELVVTRTFKAQDDGEYTTALTVEAADGQRLNSPQKVLDALLNGLAFDPLDFERAKPEERFDMIRRLLPDVPFDETEEANALDFDTRTEVSRKSRELTVRADAVAADMGATGEPIDVDALLDKMTGAAVHNSEIEQRKARRQQASQEVEDKRRLARTNRDAAERYRKDAENADAQADRFVDEADALDEKLAQAEPLPEPRDVATLRAEIDGAKVHNEKIAARQRRVDLRKQATAAEAEAEALTKAIEGRKAKLAQAIAEAEFPVAGVSFEGRNVFLGGVPFEQASDAQRLVASVQIAMALNPKLRVIRVRDGSRLDSDNLALLAGMADAHDFQCWIERVDSDGKVGVVIEDGHVRGQDPEAIVADEPVRKPRRRAPRQDDAAESVQREMDRDRE
jgi:DNA repair exonuclease SbcCD ATPase subunit